MTRDRYFRLHSDLVVDTSGVHGFGTFAKKNLPQGTLLMVIGGRIATLKQEAALPLPLRDAGLQIASDLVLSPFSRRYVGGITKVNHSCDPNAGFHGQVFLVAIRDISLGEEVTFDYAMCLGDSKKAAPYRLACHCGSKRCREIITDTDWTIPDLQARYRGFFQPYLQARIDERSHNSGFNSSIGSTLIQT